MNDQLNPKETFKELKVCVIIPTYNNGNTILHVLDEVKACCEHIIVVNDGSTDNTASLLNNHDDFELVEYQPNKGKGFGIRQGFKHALALGFDYAITFDADGQHFADDLKTFAERLREEQGGLFIGARNIAADGMPAKNTFANKFSNFWFWVETGFKLPDTQSGFRLYPIKHYRRSRFFTKRYEFEVEVLVRSAWAGIKIISLPINVRYPEDRVTHFRPLADFTRISILNTVLVLTNFLYIIPRNVFLYFKRNKFTTILREQLAAHNESPLKVSSALGFGVFMGIVPIWGFQMITAAFLAHLMKLNKILVLAASNISIPPVIPFIIYFSYKTGGLVLQMEDELSRKTLLKLKDQILEGEFYRTFQELGYSIYQYIVGAFVFGLAMGLATALISYLVIQITRFYRKSNG
jgi:glycosyltransferase involved in cell wall biosynthesis